MRAGGPDVRRRRLTRLQLERRHSVSRALCVSIMEVRTHMCVCDTCVAVMEWTRAVQGSRRCERAAVCVFMCES